MSTPNHYMYLYGLTPMKAGAAAKQLNKLIRYNNRVSDYAAYIAFRIQEGSLPQAKRFANYGNNKITYCLTEPDGTYYVINKNQYDFAVYLLGQGATTPERQAELIAEENQRIADAAEAEARANKEKEDEATRRLADRKAFNEWLDRETAAYPDNWKKQIIVNEFSKLKCGYCLRHLSLAVLIDNIDHPGVRDELISCLHIGNQTSKRAFGLITGIPLPSANRDTFALLRSISSADFKQPLAR